MDDLLYRILDCMGPHHGAGKDLADYLGISPNVITNWKNGSNRSYRKYVKEIAKRYNVSTDYLLGKTTQKEEVPAEAEAIKETPALTSKDERDIAKRLSATLEAISGEQGALMFDGEPIDDETKELLAASLRNTLEIGKRLAKQKYTPKKYRKGGDIQ